MRRYVSFVRLSVKWKIPVPSPLFGFNAVRRSSDQRSYSVMPNFSSIRLIVLAALFYLRVFARLLFVIGRSFDSAPIFISIENSDTLCCSSYLLIYGTELSLTSHMKCKLEIERKPEASSVVHGWSICFLRSCSSERLAFVEFDFGKLIAGESDLLLISRGK